MMGGGEMCDGWDSLNDVINTVVLVGKLGYGKSATGNSILGRKAFVSKFCPVGVTNTCEMESTTLRDGRIVNVIDTPGLYDWSSGSEFIGKEIVKFITMARDGIHAVLLVFSIRARFSEEEETIIERLQTFFGEKIVDYMIVVFTGGDELEEDGMSLKDYIDHAPKPLQKIIQLCKNRMVLFNNKTKDEVVQVTQVMKLFSLVDRVLVSNGGRPFSDKIFAELKDGEAKLLDKEEFVKSLKGYSEQQISDLKQEVYKSYDEQRAWITKLVEEKLNSTIEKLEKQLAGEQGARLEAEKFAMEARIRSNDEIQKLKISLDKACRENEETRRLAGSTKCLIL